MNFKINYSKIVYYVFLIFFFFSVFEISCRVILRNLSLKNKSINLLPTLELEESRRINFNFQFFRYLISMKNEPFKEKITFRTDSIGSIIPSSYEDIEKNDRYVLFCGGSTTEASQVKEGLRPTDIFEKKSNVQSINLGKSGKTLQSCINTLDQFLSKDILYDNHYPEKIVIATSINNLMQFGRDQIKEKSLPNNSKEFKSIKLIGNFVKNLKRKVTFGKISDYEKSILDGCCFGVAEINSISTGKILDWKSEKVHNSYLNYTNNILRKLVEISKNYSINLNSIYLVIEPNSFLIPYEKMYSKSWKGFDARQKLHSFDGKKMDNINSNSVLEIYNKIYANSSKMNGFKVISFPMDKIQSFSFYDAVHTTDIGSEYIGNYYANILKN